MPERAVLAIDQGTTGTTVMTISHDGRILGKGYAPVRQHYPQPGWVEHDALQIWRSVLDAADQAMAAAQGPQISAIGITNQRETTVLWDRHTGEPIAPAIVWQCRRTAERCDELRADGLASLFQERTGLVLDAYFSGTKVEWLLDNVPDARRRAMSGDLLFGTIDSWLVWKLTGGASHVIDISNASRTLLFDLHYRRWSAELLHALRVPPQILPRVVASSEVTGATVAGLHAIPAGVPVAGTAGDQQAALFGQGCYEPGRAKTTYGTGCFLLLNTGTTPVASRHQLLTTVAWQLRPDAAPAYALEGSVFIGGAVIQWLRDELGLIATAAETEQLATSVPDTAGVYLVPAFTGLGAPYWDQGARGAITGLTRGAGRAHIVRAALEGIAHQVADVVDAMDADAGVPLLTMRVDGGAAANNFLMQFQADLLDRPLGRPANLETTGFGAAALAGLATGFWRSLDDISATFRVDRTFEPHMTRSDRERQRTGWKDAVRRTRTV